MRFRDLKKIKKSKIKEDVALKQSVAYARFVDRVKALITDMFMIYAPILYIITYVFLGNKEAFQESQVAHLVGVLLYGLIYAVLTTKTGQTPGKKAYDIKVVDFKTHKNLSFFRSFLRFVVFLFSATILIGLFVQFYRKDNRSLHDLVVGSVVITIKN